MKDKMNLSWNDRLALIEHFKPSDEQACTALSISQDELNTARDLMKAGTFKPSTDIKFNSYSTVFDTSSPTVTSTRAPNRKKNVTSTKAPETASAPVRETKKRGRQGNKIANAFAHIPATPVSVNEFAKQHGVSIAVLRQSKRFDTNNANGVVYVKMDKTSKSLMIWRTPA